MYFLNGQFFHLSVNLGIPNLCHETFSTWPKVHNFEWLRETPKGIHVQQRKHKIHFISICIHISWCGQTGSPFAKILKEIFAWKPFKKYFSKNSIFGKFLKLSPKLMSYSCSEEIFMKDSFFPTWVEILDHRRVEQKHCVICDENFLMMVYFSNSKQSNFKIIDVLKTCLDFGQNL